MPRLMHQSIGGTAMWSARRRLLTIGAIWTIFLLLAGGAAALNYGTSAAGGAALRAPTPAASTRHPAAGHAAAAARPAPAGAGLLVVATTSGPVIVRASGVGPDCVGASCTNPTVSPSTASAPMSCNAGAGSTDCATKYTSNPQELLPAWRWGEATGLYSAPGVVSQVAPGVSLFVMLSQLGFALAGWVWAILLAILDWALNMSLVESSAHAINHGFSAIAGAILNSPVIAVVLFIGFLYVARLLLRARVGKVLSVILVVVIPLAALYGLTNALAPSGTAGSIPKGSPAWVATTGTNFVNTIGSELATGFGAWSSFNNSNAVTASQSGTNPTCSSYSAALYDQYYAYAKAGVAASAGAAGSQGITPTSWATFQAASATANQLQTVSSSGLTTVSILWQKSYLPLWVDAQFGSDSQGDLMYCHLLENNAAVSGDEQHQLLLISGKYQSQNFHDISPAAVAYIPGGNSNNKALESQMLAWAACERTSASNWKTVAAWQALAANGYSDGNCTDWFTKPVGDAQAGGATSANPMQGALQFGQTTASLQTNQNNALAAAGTTAAQQDAINQAATTVTGLWGHDNAQILLDSLMAFLTALIYLYALGALAIGSVLAQLGLVLMLIMLPVTLVLLAIPTKEGGRIPAGMKMLKMTIGFFVSKVALLLVLLILLEAIQTFQNLANAGGSGFLSSVINAGIPLVCLFLVRKLLTAAGMGNLTSLSGAVGMPLAAGMAATGDKALTAKMSGMLTAGGEKLGLDKADLLAKRAGKFPGVLAGKGAKKAGGALGQKANLGLRKNQLLGKKDADGKRTELGLVQRAGSLTGMLAMASGTKRGTGVADKFVNTKRGKRLADASAYRNSLDPNRNANVAKTQMDERKELIAATAGKSGSERRQAISDFYAGRGESMLDFQTGIRDRTGTLLRDSTGAAVLGWSLAEGAMHDPGKERTKAATADVAAAGKDVAADKAAVDVSVSLDTSAFTDVQRDFCHKQISVLEDSMSRMQGYLGDMRGLTGERRYEAASRRGRSVAEAGDAIAKTTTAIAELQRAIEHDRAARAVESESRKTESAARVATLLEGVRRGAPE